MRFAGRWLIVCALLLGLLQFTFAQEARTITLIHLTDYHSRAVPFYAEGQPNMAGIARVLEYLQPHADDPHTLIFNGGDTMNKGTPAWSDKYTCLEWSWFNGIVDAMAFGNHDADYGPEKFAECLATIEYPMLGSNVLAADKQPLFQVAGKTYQIYELDGIKIGVFALAGPDFERLVKPEIRPAAGATFADRVQTAEQVVQQLRDVEQVDAIVLIGHALYEDDLALAQTVPGIDLILGTHSHRLQELFTIDGTSTRYIAPFQYLTYLSKVELIFDQTDQLVDIRGQLVLMSNDLPEDAERAAQVAQLQAELEADPQYAPLFEEIGSAAVELSTNNQVQGESVLGNFVMDIVRRDAQAQVALSTSSSFREPIPPGTIIEEGLRTAMPYPNNILVYELSGAQLQELLNFSISKRGTDFFAQVSGVRFNIENAQATNISILRDAADPQAGFAPLDPAATYTLATTDFVARVAGGYKDFFTNLTPRDTGLEVREQTRAFIRAHSPVSAQLDGRMSTEALAPPTAPVPVPGQLPDTSERSVSSVWFALVLGLIIFGLGIRRLSGQLSRQR